MTLSKRVQNIIFQNMGVVDLSGEGLDASQMRAVVNMITTSCHTLILSRNNLNDCCIDALMNLKSLDLLDLSQNDIKSRIENKNIKYIDLSDNPILNKN